MKRIKFFLSVMAMVSVVMGIGSCKPEEPKEPETIAVSSVSLSTATLEMTEGDTQTLTATITPANATDRKVIWGSSASGVASVDGSGKVTAVKAGTATITASAGGKSATCKVTVTAATVAVQSVSLDKTTLSLVVGGSATLVATVKPDNATDKNVTWSSSATGIATVDENGIVKAVKAGTATITVKTDDGGKTATCKVTVTAKTVPATGITMNPTTLYLIEGQTRRVTATLTPSNSTDKISWPLGSWLQVNVKATSDPYRADFTANQLGYYSSQPYDVKAGNITKTFRVETDKARFFDARANKVVDEVTVGVGRLNGTALYFATSDSQTDYSKSFTTSVMQLFEFTVTSSDANLVSVSKDTYTDAGSGKTYARLCIEGKVAGAKENVFVKIGNVTRTIKVTVKAVPATGISLKPSSLTLIEGQSKVVTATVTPSNSTDPVVWPSTWPGVCTVNNGRFTAEKTNNKILLNNKVVRAGSASAKIEVNICPMWFFDAKAKKVVKEVTVGVGNNTALYFATYFENTNLSQCHTASVIGFSDFTVTSSNNGSVAVSKDTYTHNGKTYARFFIEGKKGGALEYVTVKIGNVIRPIKVTVKAVPATGISLKPSSLTLIEGQSKKVTATLTPSNSTDPVVWPASWPGICTVNDGWFTAAKTTTDNNLLLKNQIVRAGSASANMEVHIYPMRFFDAKTKKVVKEVTVGLGKSIALYFASNYDNTKLSQCHTTSVISLSDFTVTSSNNHSVGCYSDTYYISNGKKYARISIEGKKAGAVEYVAVKIDNVTRTIKVTVK